MRVLKGTNLGLQKYEHHRFGKQTVWISPEDHRKFDIIFVTDMGAYWSKRGLNFLLVYESLSGTYSPKAFTYGKHYRKSYEEWLKGSGYIELGKL